MMLDGTTNSGDLAGLGLREGPRFVTEPAHYRALFLDTVLRPVGGWGEEGGLAKCPGLREVQFAPSRRQAFIPS